MVHKDIWRNGSKLVSVTTLQGLISKPFLEKWKRSLCQQGVVCGFDAAKAIAEEASALGNSVHEDVAAWLTSGARSDIHTEWGTRIIDKLTEMNISKYLIEPEETLIDAESNMAGSPDFVGKDGAQVFIGDLKIKNSLDVLTGMQGMGYRYLIKRKYGVDIPLMCVVWAQKKSKGLTVKPVWIDLKEWEEPFKALVTLWNVVNPSRKVELLG